MRVALVHDWLTGMRGGEKVLEAICELFPDAPLYTLVHVPGSVTPLIEARRIVTSIAQHLPYSDRLYRHYLPVYPIAVELMDLDGYDLVISSSHCAVKSVVVTGAAVHVSYCHSPMRYAWDQFDAYFGPHQVGRITSKALRYVMRWMARWDASTAGRVDRFLANSQYVAGRIRRYYNRGSTIVYPPVDTDFYHPADRAATSRSCLIVSALVPYKRLEVAIQSCRRIGVPLKVVGTGPELSKLKTLGNSTVEFLGWQSAERIRELYRQSCATLLPGVEDFGIVPVEAQACGCPVVALDAGGARETVVHGETGMLVKAPTVAAFADGIEATLQASFDRDKIRENALRFSRSAFFRSFRAAVDDAVAHPSDRNRGTDVNRPTASIPSPSQPADRNAASMPSPSQPADRNAASMPSPSQQADRNAASMPSPSQQADRNAARMPSPSQQADRENKQ